MTVIEKAVVGLDNHVSFVIKNALESSGMEATVTNFGATLTHLLVPDVDKVKRDVVMGFDHVADYLSETSGNQYFGCTVGRTANRTAQGKMCLDGVEYKLTVNNGPNHLHGGKVGFDKRLWHADKVSESSVKFTLVSEHMDEGYPGTLQAELTYEVTSLGSLRITYLAKLLDNQPADVKTTVINMTHHSYFNLSGGLEHDILNHMLWTAADRFIPVDDNLVPTGEIKSCKDTPGMDFTTACKLAECIATAPGGGGYDHCFVLPDTVGDPFNRPAVRAACSTTGIAVEMRTTEPGFQLYSGNFVDSTASCKASTQAGRGSYRYCKHSGFCIEASKFPNAVNRPEWRQQVLLRLGEEYRQVTEYRFTAIPPGDKCEAKNATLDYFPTL